MSTTIIFALSGVMIISLITAKMLGEKRHKPLILLRLISTGDARLRELAHRGAQLYADSKERGFFFIKKQLPFRTKSLWYKGEGFVREKLDANLLKMRDIRLLKDRSHDISHFFRSIASVPKGKGEIDEVWEPQEETEAENLRENNIEAVIEESVAEAAPEPVQEPVPEPEEGPTPAPEPQPEPEPEERREVRIPVMDHEFIPVEDVVEKPKRRYTRRRSQKENEA